MNPSLKHTLKKYLENAEKIYLNYLFVNHKLVSREPFAIIEPSYGPDWGEWNDGVICPDNTFAHG